MVLHRYLHCWKDYWRDTESPCIFPYSNWPEYHLQSLTSKLHFQQYLNFLILTMKEPHLMADNLIEQLNINVKSCWNLNQTVVIDEMMVPFHGRWTYKQHVKGKPHNTGASWWKILLITLSGLKLYCLADSDYYLWDFWLYQGKDSTREHSPRIIVKEFADQIDKYHPQKPFIFVADSYYGSLEAAYDLYYRKFGCLFSCKANMPSRLFSQHLHETLAKSDWKEIHNREMSAITF